MCSQREEANRFRLFGVGRVFADGQRRDAPRLLTFDAQGLATRRQHRDVGAAGEKAIDERRAPVDEVFAVVEDHEAAATGQMIDDEVRDRGGRRAGEPTADQHPEGIGDGTADASGIRQRRQLDEEDAVGEAVDLLGSHLQ